MKNISFYTIATATAVIVGSCKPSLDAPNPSKGGIDPSKYVAIGNSITSGYADNALYYDGQMVSYANLLAEQLKTVGGGDFVQPLVGMSSVGVGSSLNGRYTLGYKTDCKGVTSLAPNAAAGDVSIFFTSVAANGPFNNMGVPGAKAITVVAPGYGNPANGLGKYNPFFYRMTTDPVNASMLSDAVKQNATFFSLFIGNNDVLGYASSGGTSDKITPSAGAPGIGFDASIDAIVSSMTANGAKGVIANIPDITNLPLFTTVPYNGLVLDAQSAAGLNFVYGPLGMSFKEGNNAFIIRDSIGPWEGPRQITADEYILLNVPQDSIKCGSYATKGIPSQYVLTAPEVKKVRDAIAAYNAKLKAVADANGFAFVDVNAFMAKVKTGIVYNGVNITTTFVSGGAFSLDGVHLTPLGNAMLANEFIKAINSKYGSTIPQVNAAKYHGVAFP